MTEMRVSNMLAETSCRSIIDNDPGTCHHWTVSVWFSQHLWRTRRLGALSQLITSQRVGFHEILEACCPRCIWEFSRATELWRKDNNRWKSMDFVTESAFMLRAYGSLRQHNRLTEKKLDTYDFWQSCLFGSRASYWTSNLFKGDFYPQRSDSYDNQPSETLFCPLVWGLLSVLAVKADLHGFTLSIQWSHS